MTGLLLSWVGLLFAPVVYALSARHPRVRVGIDRSVLVGLGFLILFVIMPDLVRHAGWVAVVLAVVGFVGPGLVEWRSHSVGHKVHAAAIVVAILGLVTHAVVDGVALHPGDHAGHGHVHDHGAAMSSLGWAVILHRLPVGLAVWSILSESFGRLAAWGGLILIALGTAAGWRVGPELLSGLSEQGFHCFEALVAGSLLHVVWHRPHDHSH